MPPYLDQNSAVLQVSQIVNLILPIFINIPLLINFNYNKDIRVEKNILNGKFINILF